MWRSACAGDAFEPDIDPAPGSLLVLRRRWTLPDGSEQWIPAHIGIMSAELTDGRPVMVEAQAGVGEVVERPLASGEALLGAVQFTEAVAKSGSLALLSFECQDAIL